MVSGRADPERDGVADYARHLTAALRDLGEEVVPVPVLGPREAAERLHALKPDLVHVQLRSRLDFTTGACRGRHNYFNATYLVDLHNGTCKFDYREVRDLFGVGEFSNQVADQVCKIEPLAR